MDEEYKELDHAQVQVWRCGPGWMVSWSMRDDTGDVISHGGVSLGSTTRPTDGADPVTAALRVILDALV